MVVPPYNSDGAGLRSFLTKLLDEADLGADAQEFESLVQDAVVMEKDLATIARFEKAIAFLGEEPDDAGVSRAFVGLDETAAAVDELLDPRCISSKASWITASRSPRARLPRLAFDHQSDPGILRSMRT